MGFTHVDARVALMGFTQSDAKTGLSFQDNEHMHCDRTMSTLRGNSLGLELTWFARLN